MNSICRKVKILIFESVCKRICYESVFFNAPNRIWIQTQFAKESVTNHFFFNVLKCIKYRLWKHVLKCDVFQFRAGRERAVEPLRQRDEDLREKLRYRPHSLTHSPHLLTYSLTSLVVLHRPLCEDSDKILEGRTSCTYILHLSGLTLGRAPLMQSHSRLCITKHW